MLIDAGQRRWAIVTLILLVVAAGAYVPYHMSALNGAKGGSWPGLAYGFIGTAFMFFAGFIGFRRKFPRLSLGRATTWLKGHLWLGTLAYPLILFHAGFSLGGPLTIVLMVLFTIVILTGIFGLIVQNIVPRLMTIQVSLETVYEQIDHVVGQLVEEADREVVALCGPLKEEAPAAEEGGGEEHAKKRGGKKGKEAQPVPGSRRLRDFYVDEVRPYLQGSTEKQYMFATSSRRGARMEQIRVLLPPTLHNTVALLDDICEERRQLVEQRKLHSWLQGWILVHLPASAALLVLTLVHAVMALYY